MKDNFSNNSPGYARFRPYYPESLFAYLLSLVNEPTTAWDCGTGNGQVAGVLSNYFKSVFATDISESQICNAIVKDNIYYSKQTAGHSSFPSHFFDIITVAQAIHWFDFNVFYKEVYRTLKPNGVIAIIGYGLFTSNPDLDKTIGHFYSDTLGSYWDKERKYIDEAYRSIPFPFQEMDAPGFQMEYEWEAERLIGYLNTWSAVQHYIRKNNRNPVDDIAEQLRRYGGNKIEVSFPLLLRVGRLYPGSISK